MNSADVKEAIAILNREPLTSIEIEFRYDDGGRKAAGYKGSTGDCVVRAIAIAEDRPYKEVYKELAALQGEWTGGAKTCRNGVNTHVYRHYLMKRGYIWIQTMSNGERRVHLKASELPGRGLTVICEVSKHMATVKDRVLHDTYDCSRNGTRMVYGMWVKAEDWANTYEPTCGKQWFG